MRGKLTGRGPEATQDMMHRLEDGWTVEQLWNRCVEAEGRVEGFTYEYADGIPEDPRLRRRKSQVFVG